MWNTEDNPKSYEASQEFQGIDTYPKEYVKYRRQSKILEASQKFQGTDTSWILTTRKCHKTKNAFYCRGVRNVTVFFRKCFSKEHPFVT